MLQLWTKKKAGRVFQLTAKPADVDVSGWAHQFMTYEDALVAAVFGTAACLPFDSFMGEILKQADVLAEEFSIEKELEPDEVHLWPTVKHLGIGHSQKSVSPSSPSGKGKGPELDGLWRFGSKFLIMEAKRPRASFDPDQPVRYVELIRQYANSIGCADPTIGVLLVGNGWSARSSAAEVDKTAVPNLLFIEWAGIAKTIREIVENVSPHVRRALEDVEVILNMQVLRPYEGFTWPSESFTQHLTDDPESQASVRTHWFRPRIYPALPDPPIHVAPSLPFAWMQREEIS